MLPPMDGLRERKKARVREEIAGAALRLFLERGFEATTIDDIAAAAEVGRRTVFRYFPTKEDVAFPDYAARLARFEALLCQGGEQPRQGGEQPPLRRVQSALRGLAADLVRERAAVVAWQRVVESSPALLAHERTLDLGWEAAIARGLAVGTVGAPSRRVRLAAGALFGVLRATVRLWIEGGARHDLAALGEEAFALLERGLAQPPFIAQPERRPRSAAPPSASPQPEPEPELAKSARFRGRKTSSKGR